jgi:glyoxylate reductase
MRSELESFKLNYLLAGVQFTFGSGQTMKRVLSLRPFAFLDPSVYETKYELSIVSPKTMLEQERPFEYLIQKINEFKPDAILLTHYTGMTDEQQFPNPFICEEFFQRVDKKNLKILASHSAGYDHIDVSAAKKHNIIVTNTPDVLSDACADFTMLLILSVARRSSEFEMRLRKGEWQGSSTIFGVDLKDKTLGIVGYGGIGQAVAIRAKAFGMKIVYHKRREEKDCEYKFYENLDDLLATSDFVSLHVPLSSETKHLINKNSFSKMKKTSYLINASRGPVVDEQALVDALKSNQIAGCGLDVFENEPEIHKDLLDLPNVSLFPHVSSQTSDTRTKMEKLCWDNIDAVLRGEKPLTPLY